MVRSLLSEGSCSKFTLEFLSEVESKGWREGGKEGQRGKGTGKDLDGRRGPGQHHCTDLKTSLGWSCLVMEQEARSLLWPGKPGYIILKPPQCLRHTEKGTDVLHRGMFLDPSEGASVYESGSPNTTLEVLPNQGQSVEARSRASPRFIHP